MYEKTQSIFGTTTIVHSLLIASNHITNTRMTVEYQNQQWLNGLARRTLYNSRIKMCVLFFIIIIRMWIKRRGRKSQHEEIRIFMAQQFIKLAIFFFSLFDALRMALPQIAHLFTPIIEYETQDKTFRSDHIGHCARETSGTNGRNQSMNILSIEASLCPVQIQIHRLLKKKSFLFAKYNNIMRHGCCE